MKRARANKHTPNALRCIIVLELLAVSKRNNDQIKGIAVDDCEIKLVIFADDLTSFVRDKLSHHTVFETIDLFGTYSGLKVNHDKTEILPLGNMDVSRSELDVDEISKVITILRGLTLPLITQFFIS